MYSVKVPHKQNAPLANELCVSCGKDRRVRGSPYCESCSQKSNHRRLKDAGLCVSCRRPRGDGDTTTYCQKCAAKERERTRRRLAKRVRSGLCVRCAKRRGKDSTSIHCRECADKMAEYARKRFGREKLSTTSDKQI